MSSEDFYDIALRGYAASLKAGEASLYESLRFFQNWFRYEGDDREELVHRAALALIRHDPFFLMTDPHGNHLEGFSEEEILSCVDSWSVDDEGLAALLEGHLRMATVSRCSPDLDRVRGALGVLEKAKPGYGSDKRFLKIYVDALRILGDERYAAAFDELLEKTEPEWHAHELKDAMRHAVEEDNWVRYDALRERWGAMPKNAHICECSINYIANIDGLRSLERGDEDGALRFLSDAVSVAGCPHLNSGGGAVRLAHELLDRKLARKEVAEHLKALEEYCETEETAELRSRLADNEVWG